MYLGCFGRVARRELSLVELTAMIHSISESFSIHAENRNRVVKMMICVDEVQFSGSWSSNTLNGFDRLLKDITDLYGDKYECPSYQTRWEGRSFINPYGNLRYNGRVKIDYNGNRIPMFNIYEEDNATISVICTEDTLFLSKSLGYNRKNFSKHVHYENIIDGIIYLIASTQ